jgi:YfiH family protein
MKRPELHFYDFGSDVVAFSSTRLGGYSVGNYGEWNINRYCGDSTEAICRNRQALCEMLGIEDDKLLMPHQVHLTEIARIDEELLCLSAEERQQKLEGIDAIMTNLRGVCIGVSTADCIPILLYDKKRHAACAIHAGWRGTVSRIAEKAVIRMGDSFGSIPSDIIAQIGPGISLDSFEVGQEVFDAFAAAGFDMPTISKRYAKWHINLPECNRQQLIVSGLCADRIRLSGICTYKSYDTFFSARRLGINSGRIFTGILLNP